MQIFFNSLTSVIAKLTKLIEWKLNHMSVLCIFQFIYQVLAIAFKNFNRRKKYVLII